MLVHKCTINQYVRVCVKFFSLAYTNTHTHTHAYACMRSLEKEMTQKKNNFACIRKKEKKKWKKKKLIKLKRKYTRMR